ncbi:putative phage tail protein [Paenibacillus gorillae]|uniref:putative phage tail protein n=1 Tax=Paenibacillus gorillae TaxID=1243662 RepID=UPI0005A843D9|nr:putative phage tail protein [Paenibacillus gorillae]
MNDTVESPIGKILMNHLLEFYADIKESRIICQTEGTEFDSLESASAGLLSQRFVDSATWGLQRWEKELGIAVTAGQPFEQRRAVIWSRMRGTGTVRTESIKVVAGAYTNGEVEVLENFSESTITLKFVSVLGIPPNIADLTETLRSLIPAHLFIRFEYIYTTWGNIEAAPEFTWSDLKDRNITFQEWSVVDPFSLVLTSLGLTGSDH